eukprot:2161607-Pyramimonas_sp.AAC.2
MPVLSSPSQSQPREVTVRVGDNTGGDNTGALGVIRQVTGVNRQARRGVRTAAGEGAAELVEYPVVLRKPTNTTTHSAEATGFPALSSRSDGVPRTQQQERWGSPL